MLVRKNNNVHPVMSSRKLVTGRDLKVPILQLGQYVQAHLGGSNSVEEERTCNALYIGRSDSNKKGHLVFKLSTRQPISCNKVTEIPVTQDHINRVNEIGKKDHQPDSLVITDASGNTTILDIDTKDDSLDEHDEDYQPNDDKSQPSAREANNDECILDSMEPIQEGEADRVIEEQMEHFDSRRGYDDSGDDDNQHTSDYASGTGTILAEEQESEEDNQSYKPEYDTDTVHEEESDSIHSNDQNETNEENAADVDDDVDDDAEEIMIALYNGCVCNIFLS